MPPLSAYTPFESLLFFQSLAALDARPANFASISDGLRNNRFVRENVAFDAGRLAPEALEDLYTTLTRDGIDGVANVSSNQPNGRHEESPSAHNAKKRKISSPKPDGLVDKGVIGHAGILPEIVSHLYARYRELVTKEIKNEEKKYNEIRDELERLKQERETVPEPMPTPVAVPKPTPEIPAAKHHPAPDPMDVDTQDEKSTHQPRPDVAQNSSAPKPSPELKQPTQEPHRKEVETPKQPTPITPRPAAQQKPQKQLQPIIPPPSPAPPVKQSPTEQPKKTPTQPSPLKPHQQQPPLFPQPTPPNHSAQTFQVQPPNGQPSPASQPPILAPRDIPTPQAPTTKPPLPPQVPSHSPPGPPAGAVPTPASTAVQPPPIAKPPLPSPTPKKTPQPAKAAGKETSSTPAPKTTQPPTLQPTIQQWSLNQPPQTPHPPSHQKAELLGQAPAGKPLPPPSSQQTPKPQPKKLSNATPSASVPSTPLPVSAAVKPPAPGGYGGYETPVAAAHALLQSQPRSSLPRLSIDTSGSVTPWKKAPRLTLPHSPRSPDRPRPEDVSPISEKAPSLMGSREATPEEPEPPRRKRRYEAKGSSRGREPSPPASDADSKSGPRSKSEKSSFSVNKRRDQSTASSRSRGRSVLSREDEAAADPPGRIKREMPSTPSGVPDVAEAEHRTSGIRKSVAAAPEEQRPGRGRPKRKRAPSEAFESEPPQPEISQLSRIDPNQSTSYVLCARSFPKTGQAIMNNVTTHKHASVFSKPLTERDAPGYRDLIYRPQDLKSIKSSITQGSKALAAATEAVSTPVADGESPIPTSGTPSKNSVLMLQKSEDVIPPKGIVNSAQLEKELIRMFSNATMFNPIPQRGFGPAFPMIPDGESRESTIVPEPDEGGIIKATHEMFEDVEKAVTGWRQAERTSDEMASKSILSLRRGSASDFNTDSADEVKGS
ncbi:hypothetical protein P170DRAFT_437533 [Aspergillus steynii IBT 23096]|uniref:Bromo domain-containing protein n=1 Tax=Aspergillus steynii IBT 23096 TaxID=1392250 RepID=A0A2I2G4J9_9EURO|nr:uncharacterized protein P170DRAFT_437533 [Aspergillus steynii IBT 23096]PLB47789.1 hypothetical protein P170DRAFT_437533 [Aspergillus steynii IBT 23096]